MPKQRKHGDLHNDPRFKPSRTADTEEDQVQAIARGDRRPPEVIQTISYLMSNKLPPLSFSMATLRATEEEIYRQAGLYGPEVDALMAEAIRLKEEEERKPKRKGSGR